MTNKEIEKELAALEENRNPDLINVKFQFMLQLETLKSLNEIKDQLACIRESVEFMQKNVSY